MACVGEYGRCDLLPAGDEGSVFELESGSEAKTTFVDGGEELYVVVGVELCVEPLFVQGDRNGVKFSGGSGVEPDGTGSESSVACCGGAPEGLGYVRGEPLSL